MIENASAILRDVEIGEAVAVVVSNGNALAITTRGDSCFLRNVGEGAVAIVAVECVSQRLRGSVEIALAAVDEVDVHPAVVVVIEESAARSGGFRKILRGRMAGGVHPVDATLRRRDFFKRIRWWRRREPGASEAEVSGRGAHDAQEFTPGWMTKVQNDVRPIVIVERAAQRRLHYAASSDYEWQIRGLHRLCVLRGCTP